MADSNAVSDAELFFEEVSGNRRRVILRGSTGPMGGVRRKDAFSLGGELRSTRTYEPGVSAPVRHVFGSRERDIEVEGHLRDGLIGIDGEAERQRSLIESIRRDGEELRILWNGIARRGYLAESEFKVEGGSDFVYRLRFEIDAVDDGEDAQKRRPRTSWPSLDPSGMLDTLSARQSAMLSIPGLSLDVAGTLGDLFAGVTAPLSQLISAFEDVEAGVEDVVGAYRRAVNSAVAMLQRVQHLSGYLSGDVDPSDTNDGLAIARWERQRAEALAVLRDVAARAIGLGTEAELRARGASSGRVVVASAGDTFESIGARERVAVGDLRALNPGLSFELSAGVKVRLP